MTLADAHKTGKRIRRVGSKWGTISSWFNDDDFNFTISMSDAIADDWEVEPEVYEVECEWRKDESSVVHPSGFKELYLLIGKRTKLTIEVLD
jgi:hypothetical protein